MYRIIALENVILIPHILVKKLPNYLCSVQNVQTNSKN